MKKFLLLVFFIAVIAFSGCSMGTICDYSNKEINSESNLIENSSFEVKGDIDDFPLNWALLQDSDNILLHSDDQNSGQTSLLIKENEDLTCITSESFPIDPTGVYLSRCFVKSIAKLDNPVELVLVTFDENGNKVSSSRQKLIPNQDWKELKFTTGFFDPKSKFARLTVVIPELINNSILIDDVESYKLHRFAFSQK